MESGASAESSAPSTPHLFPEVCDLETDRKSRFVRNLRFFKEASGRHISDFNHSPAGFKFRSSSDPNIHQQLTKDQEDQLTRQDEIVETTAHQNTAHQDLTKGKEKQEETVSVEHRLREEDERERAGRNRRRTLLEDFQCTTTNTMSSSVVVVASNGIGKPDEKEKEKEGEKDKARKGEMESNGVQKTTDPQNGQRLGGGTTDRDLLGMSADHAPKRRSPPSGRRNNMSPAPSFRAVDTATDDMSTETKNSTVGAGQHQQPVSPRPVEGAAVASDPQGGEKKTRSRRGSAAVTIRVEPDSSDPLTGPAKVKDHSVHLQAEQALAAAVTGSAKQDDPSSTSSSTTAERRKSVGERGETNSFGGGGAHLTGTAVMFRVMSEGSAMHLSNQSSNGGSSNGGSLGNSSAGGNGKSGEGGAVLEKTSADSNERKKGGLIARYKNLVASIDKDRERNPDLVKSLTEGAVARKKKKEKEKDREEKEREDGKEEWERGTSKSEGGSKRKKRSGSSKKERTKKEEHQHHHQQQKKEEHQQPQQQQQQVTKKEEPSKKKHAEKTNNKKKKKKVKDGGEVGGSVKKEKRTKKAVLSKPGSVVGLGSVAGKDDQTAKPRGDADPTTARRRPQEIDEKLRETLRKLSVAPPPKIGNHTPANGNAHVSVSVNGTTNAASLGEIGVGAIRRRLMTGDPFTAVIYHEVAWSAAGRGTMAKPGRSLGSKSSRIEAVSAAATFASVFSAGETTASKQASSTATVRSAASVGAAKRDNSFSTSGRESARGATTGNESGSGKEDRKASMATVAVRRKSTDNSTTSSAAAKADILLFGVDGELVIEESEDENWDRDLVDNGTTGKKGKDADGRIKLVAPAGGALGELVVEESEEDEEDWDREFAGDSPKSVSKKSENESGKEKKKEEATVEDEDEDWDKEFASTEGSPKTEKSDEKKETKAPVVNEEDEEEDEDWDKELEREEKEVKKSEGDKDRKAKTAELVSSSPKREESGEAESEDEDWDKELAEEEGRTKTSTTKTKNENENDAKGKAGTVSTDEDGEGEDWDKEFASVEGLKKTTTEKGVVDVHGKDEKKEEEEDEDEDWGKEFDQQEEKQTPRDNNNNSNERKKNESSPNDGEDRTKAFGDAGKGDLLGSKEREEAAAAAAKKSKRRSRKEEKSKEKDKEKEKEKGAGKKASGTEGGSGGVGSKRGGSKREKRKRTKSSAAARRIEIEIESRQPSPPHSTPSTPRSSGSSADQLSRASSNRELAEEEDEENRRRDCESPPKGRFMVFKVQYLHSRSPKWLERERRAQLGGGGLGGDDSVDSNSIDGDKIVGAAAAVANTSLLASFSSFLSPRIARKEKEKEGVARLGRSNRDLSSPPSRDGSLSSSSSTAGPYVPFHPPAFETVGWDPERQQWSKRLCPAHYVDDLTVTMRLLNEDLILIYDQIFKFDARGVLYSWNSGGKVRETNFFDVYGALVEKEGEGGDEVGYLADL